MDSQRFRTAIDELQPYFLINLRNEVLWMPQGDPGGTPRGGAVAECLARLRNATRAYIARHPLGPTSSPLMDSRGNLLRKFGARQEGDVSFKETIVREMHGSLPDFVFSESTSAVEFGILDFVRRNPSGTRNLVIFSRDKYGGAFGVDAAASAVPCAEMYLDMASTNPMDTANPSWGLRRLTAMMGYGPAGNAWTWIYRDQRRFEEMLTEALGRIKHALLPMFSDLEPTLSEMRALARR